jgi:sialic acid synthase SpsE
VSLVLDSTDKILHFLGLKITRASSIATGRKTDVQLGALAVIARINNCRPVIVVESIPRYGRVWNRIATRVVVELDKKGIELGLTDHLAHVEVFIASRALGGTGNDDVFSERAKLIDHGNVGAVR